MNFKQRYPTTMHWNIISHGYHSCFRTFLLVLFFLTISSIQLLVILRDIVKPKNRLVWILQLAISRYQTTLTRTYFPSGRFLHISTMALTMPHAFASWTFI